MRLRACHIIIPALESNITTINSGNTIYTQQKKKKKMEACFPGKLKSENYRLQNHEKGKTRDEQ